MIKIVHIINGLGSGGAENMLYKLLKYSNRDLFYHEVISLMDQGVYGEKIEELGIPVRCLNLTKKNFASSLTKARQIVREFDVVDTWLYHADFLGFFVGKVMTRKKLIWNVRHSNLDKGANKPTTLKIVKLNSFLSRYVNCITYNSNRALENHLKNGYSDRNSHVIPNGFELDKFRFSLDDRIRLRRELQLRKEDSAIITVGRWDIQKDYQTLLKALKELKKQNAKFKMVMVGTKLDDSNQELINLIDRYKLGNNILLLGRQSDIPALLSAADIYVSSSLGESFSNAIAEAMACELPCVVTDVGDSKLIVGETGVVVEAQNHEQLSKGLAGYIRQNDMDRNVNARERVINKYDIYEVVGTFKTLWGTISEE